MTDRFDLEQWITNVHCVVDDLDLFLKEHSDRPVPMTEDDVFNYIFAIRNILDLRCTKLWDTFLQAYELDQYRKPMQEDLPTQPKNEDL